MWHFPLTSVAPRKEGPSKGEEEEEDDGTWPGGGRELASRSLAVVPALFQSYGPSMLPPRYSMCTPIHVYHAFQFLPSGTPVSSPALLRGGRWSGLRLAGGLLECAGSRAIDVRGPSFSNMTFNRRDGVRLIRFPPPRRCLDVM